VNPTAVHHFGPDTRSVGGMATVIRLLEEHNVGAEMVDAHPTWRPRSPRGTVRLVASAAQALLQIPAGEVAHMHLSEGGSFLREGFLLALARRRGLIVVATIHGASFIPFAARYPRLVSAVLRRAHAVTCLEKGALERVRRSAPLVHCEILPNPVIVDDSFLPADETEELVVFAGEIGLRKGADVLYRAWQLISSRCPRARCLMVGPITDFVPPTAERLEVRPPVGPVEMKEILRSARLVALPAREEGMPMVLAEAMSLGRPFVSTPVGGIPELAAEGGRLVLVGDEDGLAEHLTDLLAKPALARTIGERGWRFCWETRRVEVIDARLRELYSAASAEKQ
jgi:glycosyltransferase involved in cell wall biosynthesis